MCTESVGKEKSIGHLAKLVLASYIATQFDGFILDFKTYVLCWTFLRVK